MNNLEIVAIVNRDDNIKEVRFVLNHEDAISFRGTAMLDASDSNFKIDEVKKYIIDLFKKEMEI